MKHFYSLPARIGLLLVVALSVSFPSIAQISLVDSLFETVSQVDRLHARTGDKVLPVSNRLDQRSPIGYQNLLPVQVGQQITAEVYAHYEKKQNKKWLKTLFGAVGGASVIHSQQVTINPSNEGYNTKKVFPLVGVGVAVTPFGLKGVFKSIPEAFIKYNIYDKDSNFVESTTQFITKEARDQWELLRLDKKITQDGFVEVIIVNKDKRAVWFDDLTITIEFTVQQNGKDTLKTNQSTLSSNTDNLYNVYIRSFAPPGSFEGFDYTDDGRGFSVSQNVTSRIRQQYQIIPDGVNPALATVALQSSPTHKISTNQSQTAAPTGNVQIYTKSQNSGNNNVTVTSFYEGSNPFEPVAPDIEVSTKITFSENFQKTKLTVSVEASSKRFPALELFIGDTGGRRVFLTTEAAYGTPYDLIIRPADYYTSYSTVVINITTNGQFIDVYSPGGPEYTIGDWNQDISDQYPGPYR